MFTPPMLFPALEFRRPNAVEAVEKLYFRAVLQFGGVEWRQGVRTGRTRIETSWIEITDAAAAPALIAGAQTELLLSYLKEAQAS